MLNKDGIRELAYVVTIDAIEPIVGSDNCESAVVGGWHCMVRKNTLKAGDKAVYFEIDSHLDTTKPEFAFLEKKHGNIKTQKYTFGGKNEGYFSQGLIMGFEDLNLNADEYEVGDFLTATLGVTYAEVEDNSRKAKSDPDAKYKTVLRRHPKLAKKFGKFIMSHTWAKKLMYFFLHKKNDKKSEFPSWVVKTDEERIQNLSGRISEFRQEHWVATEKVDGTSTTFSLKKNKKGFDYYVCSRNVVMKSPSMYNPKKKCYYDTVTDDGNVYLEMDKKYNMEDKMTKMFKDEAVIEDNLAFLTVQGETYGGNIQKRKYGAKHNLAVFNVIFGYTDGKTKRLNPFEMQKLCDYYGLPTVPVLTEIELPDSVDGILALAGGESVIDGGMREGLVFRTLDGKKSFKAVDNEFLAKYHG